jgi:hypothetical protein
MRIASVEAIPLSIPLTKNFGGSTYNVLTRCTVVASSPGFGVILDETLVKKYAA